MEACRKLGTQLANKSWFKDEWDRIIPIVHLVSVIPWPYNKSYYLQASEEGWIETTDPVAIKTFEYVDIHSKGEAYFELLRVSKLTSAKLSGSNSGGVEERRDDSRTDNSSGLPENDPRRIVQRPAVKGFLELCYPDYKIVNARCIWFKNNGGTTRSNVNRVVIISGNYIVCIDPREDERYIDIITRKISDIQNISWKEKEQHYFTC